MANRKERRAMAKDKPRKEASDFLHLEIQLFMYNVTADLENVIATEGTKHAMDEAIENSCVDEDYVNRFNNTHLTLVNNEWWTQKYVRPEYFKEMFMEGYMQMQKDFPGKSNREIIDELFDSYKRSRNQKQKPYIKPKGPGVKR